MIKISDKYAENQIPLTMNLKSSIVEQNYS